jgi:hypothetical protein
METLPFRALWTTEPWGVMSFDLDNGFRLWRGREWLRHRGGMRSHYGDIASSRTIMVDHLEFCPESSPGIGADVLGRRIGLVTLAMVVGIVTSRDDQGVDHSYLSRCFARSEAELIMAALGAFAAELNNSSLAPSEENAYTKSAIVYRKGRRLVIR